jgi:hypothetical protein
MHCVDVSIVINLDEALSNRYRRDALLQSSFRNSNRLSVSWLGIYLFTSSLSFMRIIQVQTFKWTYKFELPPSLPSIVYAFLQLLRPPRRSRIVENITRNVNRFAFVSHIRSYCYRIFRTREDSISSGLSTGSISPTNFLAEHIILQREQVDVDIIGRGGGFPFPTLFPYTQW